MLRFFVALLLPIAGVTGETLRLSHPLTVKHLALEQPPLSFPFHRNLQDNCEDALESTLNDSFDIPEVTHSCECGDDSSATCDSVFPENCKDHDCSEFECVDSDVTSVQVCTRLTIRTGILLNESDSEGRPMNVENSRSLIIHYTRGVDNVCEQIETYSGYTPNYEPTDCAVYWDGQECTSCSFCAQAEDAITRIIDCSNIDPDAIDSDCVPETDFVDGQVLKLSSSAECTSFASDTSSADNSFIAALGLVVSVACVAFAQFW